MDDTNTKLYEKAVKRAENAGICESFQSEIIAFLEKEIDGYRDKIMHMENRLEELHAELHAAREAGQETTLEAVQESTAGEIIKALADNGYKNISINLYKE